ncbi:MAG TPA: hypothetical protein ENK10_10600 [Acidobacteria bacterium]|nr:hypothetical protein [Acidobacteriota bacterium]
MRSTDLNGGLLVAHRGGSALAPENSAAALCRALEAGAAAVEIDVRPTADGLLVVLHDPTPERLTGARRPARETPAAELVAQEYSRAPGERLLLLDEALALLAERVLLDIELKPDPPVPAEEIVRRLLAALERAGSPQRLVVTSTDIACLEALHRAAPALRTGLVFRSSDRRDPVTTARACGAGLVVAQQRRLNPDLVTRIVDAQLELWAYTVNDPIRARTLLALGVGGLVTDDEQALGRALEMADPARPATPEGEMILALDLGSTATKAALVDPAGGKIVHRVSAPTPIRRARGGVVEHDPRQVLDTIESLIVHLARGVDLAAPPVAAALASQRSTGLWVDGSAAPLSLAPSWQDTRGSEVLAALEPRRSALEAATGLPMLAAWTAVKGAWLRETISLPPGARLTPLGSWIAARLCRSELRVDPTLANRMFLLEAAGAQWSEAALDAFRLTPDLLPELVPSLALHGSLAWPGGGEIPLLTLIGDQQAAYVGAAGPLGRRLVLNAGTAAFAMRSAAAGEPPLPGGRRAPLWTSRRRRTPPLFLLEKPLLPERETQDSGPFWHRHLARRLALGDPAPQRRARDLANATAGLMRGGRQGGVMLSGGILDSPQMVALLRQTLEAPLVCAAERELTLLGAARLAAATAGRTWPTASAGA